MLFDFLFVTGDPFGVVLVLREIDIELVFSHMRGCVDARMCRCADVYYNANIYVYIIYQYIQYSVLRTPYSVFKEQNYKQNNKQNECLL